MLLLYEVVVDVVKQFGLFVGFGAFAPDVVKEYSKGADAQFINLASNASRSSAVHLMSTPG